MVVDCRDLQLYLYMDVGHATLEDLKCHTGRLVSMGKLGEHGVLFVWKSLKQKFTIVNSTSVELIGVSDMFDLLQCAHELAEFNSSQPGKRLRSLYVYQDNTSTIIIIAYMVVHAPSPSHANVRFFDIRYFWF